MEPSTKYRKQLINWIKKFLSFYSINTLLTIISKYKKHRITNLLINLKSFRSALALSGVTAIYHILNLTLPKLLGINGKSSKLVNFTAGALSSLCFYFDPNQSRIQTIYTMIVVRTLHFGIRSLMYKPKAYLKSETHKQQLALRSYKNKKVRMVQKLIDRYGNVTIFVYPKYLAKSYVNSLNFVADHQHRYGKDFNTVLRGISSIVIYLASQPASHPLNWIPVNKSTKSHLSDLLVDSKSKDMVQDFRGLLKVLDDNIHHDRLLCAAFHPNETSCELAAISEGYLVSKRMFKPYLMLNSLGIRRFNPVSANDEHQGSKDKQSVKSLVVKWIIDTIRSVTMITLYFTFIVYSICTLRRVLGRETITSYGLAGAFATPAILFDKPGRLLELNNYSMGKSLETLMMAPVFGSLTVILEGFSYAPVGLVAPLLRWFYDIKK
ncbi:hypothetical protein HDV02_005947 [Globomyces sp. JEL0801]|nr:hypothetical protein HDV02_005947 [Globomyces sp. JEL0801]